MKWLNSNFQISMKRSLVFIIAVFLFSPLLAQYEVRGGSGRPLSAEKTGITEVYLLNGLDGAQIKFTSSLSETHQWYRYKESIDDAVPIPCTQSGNASVITDILEGYGYYVAAPVGTGYIWIVDYSLYVPRFSGLRVMEDEYKCERLKLIADADVTPIYYYAGGRRNTLQRKFHLAYNTLIWQEDGKVFIPEGKSLKLNEIFPEIEVNEPPLTNTTFTLTDSLALYFDIAQAVTSEEYRAVKVEAHYTAEKDREFSDNEKYRGDSLSAPVNYTFTAYANEPVAAYYVWKVLKYDESGQTTTIVRYTDRVLRYTFENQGKYMVQLEVDDAQSTCTDIPDPPFNVVIGKTEIFIPNAFSPGSSIGVNDEFKISFRSITSFRASIYNRWGNLLFQWTDPAKGWNGMVNGKFVPTGAYFVVVEYTDSEGKKQKAARDVNILRAKD
jgi:gliding motility-associated-like protein